MIQTDRCLNDCSECEAFYDCPDHTICECCTGPADSDNSEVTPCGHRLCDSCSLALCDPVTDCAACILYGDLTI